MSTLTRPPTEREGLETPHLLRQLDDAESCGQWPALLVAPSVSDPLSWLERYTTDFKVFWQDRPGTESWAGCGAFREVTSGPHETMQSVLGRCQQILQQFPAGLRWFGGFAFDPHGGALREPWTDWGRGRFWLPRATWHDGHMSLIVEDANDAATVRRWLQESASHRRVASGESSPFPQLVRRVDRPSEPAWNEGVDQALEMFANEVLEKIVLAREVQLEFADRIDPWRLLRRLAKASQQSFVFALQRSTDNVFLGATPERLYRREGRHLESEVVAGTRRRHTDPEIDRQLGQELLKCEKDQLEHHIVRKSIRQRLHGCVDRLEVDSQATLLRLASKQHLYSRVRGTLRADVGDEDLLVRLHPTPAVGGYPTENALAEIARLEPFERGWYAAPVGWVDGTSAEFVVAIRSALVTLREVRLYSGAGIVPGSQPSAEWDEIEAKLSDLLRCLSMTSVGHGNEMPWMPYVPSDR